MFTTFSRRQLAKIAAWSALGVSTASAKSEVHPVELKPRANAAAGSGFPGGFLWGTATSAYQVEGAVNEDGRGPSIWDAFARTPGKIVDRSNADRASDHYHRYKEDVQLMKAMGAKAYRFSIAWPRVFPDGAGEPNPQGLDFYHRLVDECLANGIEPFATLYHWDLPQVLQDRFGGWESRDTAQAFGEYAGYVAERLSDRVKSFFTINECGRFVEAGYGGGPDAPGLKLPQQRVNQARHHVALAHGLAVQAIRAHGRAGTKVGPAENIVVCVPAIETPANIRAAEIATREMNAGYLTAILEGKYTAAFLAYAGANAPKYTPEDLKTISSPIDYVGINVYTPHYYVTAADDVHGFAVLPMPASFPHTSSPWHKIDPAALYWAPRHVAKLWNPKAIYITENGLSSSDRPAADGQVYDLDRIMLLRSYLGQLQRATAEGVPVQGYFLWSLLDNFEWSDGLDTRYGLYHVDFETLKRTPKLSVSFYREVIARNAVA